MGWLSIPLDKRPTNQELNSMASDWLESPDYRIIDRSAWMQYGSQQFILMEGPHPQERQKTNRFIVTILVKYRRGELYHKETDESMGPLQHDCPMRLLHQLEGHPPLNEFSAGWREKVVQHHHHTRAVRNILNTLRRNHPQQQSLILTDGREVQYCQGTYRKRLHTSAYWDPQTRQTTLLRPRDIDPQATPELWNRTQAQGQAEQTTRT